MEKYATIVNKLHDTNAKDGNLLLNIGPDGDVNVPQEALNILNGCRKNT